MSTRKKDIFDVFGAGRKGREKRPRYKKEKKNYWAPEEGEPGRATKNHGKGNEDSDDEEARNEAEVDSEDEGDEDNKPGDEEEEAEKKKQRELKEDTERRKDKVTTDKLKAQGIDLNKDVHLQKWNRGKQQQLSKTREQLDKIFKAQKDEVPLEKFSMDGEEDVGTKEEEDDAWYKEWKEKALELERDGLDEGDEAEGEKKEQESTSVVSEKKEEILPELDPIAERKKVVSYLRPGENVLRALRRLGATASSSKSNSKSKSKSNLIIREDPLPKSSSSSSSSSSLMASRNLSAAQTALMLKNKNRQQKQRTKPRPSEKVAAEEGAEAASEIVEPREDGDEDDDDIADEGPNSKSNSPAKRRRKGQGGEKAGEEKEERDAAEHRAAFDALTTAAQNLLDAGHMDIYQETYESINRLVKDHDKQSALQEDTARARVESAPQTQYTPEEGGHGWMDAREERKK